MKPDSRVMDALDDLGAMYTASRAFLPYIPESVIGEKDYEIEGMRWHRLHPITPEQRAKHNQAANWNNENFVIRLWAVLESHGFKGTKESRTKPIQLLYELRCHFAHGRGRDDKERQRLRGCVMREFNVQNASPGVIPLDKDRVLKRMLELARKYVRGVLNG